jgi:signal transduction histidine kinase
MVTMFTQAGTMQTEPKPSPRLLVVDDRTDNLIVLEQVISEHLPHCEVVTAASAAEGLAVAASTRLDGALIDLQMPEMDGIEMCRRLKITPSTAAIPLMLVTSHSANARTKARGLEAGADDFINRPIDNLELIGRIKVMLRVKQAEDSLRELNERLEDLVQMRTQKLRDAARRHAMLSRKVLVVQEEERARLSRELHDELGQVLTALQYELGWLQRKATDHPDEAAHSFRNAIEMVDRAATELRRICKALRPPLLDDLGVKAALKQLVEEFEKHSNLACDLSLPADGAEERISDGASLCVYRVLQESLHNAMRHADASAVRISLAREGNHLVLSVRDDGRGFGADDPSTTQGSGIAGMRERAHLVDGVIRIESSPRQGTTVVLRVPLEEAGEERCDD